ncbi:MAG TPA: DNA gyrase inhibitor YacG [Candidatus Koribacter sp.]|jgi:hypothetical protein
MAKKKTTGLRCPTCRKIVLRTDADFPFCSERCKMIDLGKWASGGYVISTPINNAGEDLEGDYNLNAPRTKGPNGGSGKPN